ncbi:MAG: hypothetical protein V3W45_07790 [Sedimentisphaerales bacterium]
MAVEAPISKFRKNNLKIYIVACLIAAIILAYDGYLSKYQWSHRRSFYEKHVKDGRPDETMMFNQIAPPFLIVLAAILMGRLWAIKDRKLLADENELIVSDKKRIPYDSIQKIDKTHFEKKGRFVITYKNKCGKDVNRKLSDRNYDNLKAILDKLVAKIS